MKDFKVNSIEEFLECQKYFLDKGCKWKNNDIYTKESLSMIPDHILVDEDELGYYFGEGIKYNWEVKEWKVFSRKLKLNNL